MNKYIFSLAVLFSIQIFGGDFSSSSGFNFTNIHNALSIKEEDVQAERVEYFKDKKMWIIGILLKNTVNFYAATDPISTDLDIVFKCSRPRHTYETSRIWCNTRISDSDMARLFSK